ncbi:MAG: hypothetical protein AAF590_07675 [Pseudomonadota bacterium]
MAQRIILIHGRSVKPAKRQQTRLVKEALLQGLNRVDAAKANAVRGGTVKVDFVYYGDINNKILGEHSTKDREKLTASDPDFNNAPCLPHEDYDEGLEAIGHVKTFNKRTYRKILAENKDLQFIDDASRALSTVASLLTASFLNEVAIKRGTADMGAYLMQRSVGSQVRERLQAPLRKALKAGDDICLVSHSMGCMVAYDVLWKFSRMSEYRDLRENGNRVASWVALGSPLGEAGVKANLYDADERAYDGGTDKHPKNIVKHWHNIAAHDDFICHDATMKDDYKAMRTFGYVETIKDHRIYNCWTRNGTSNPHNFYGYLVHPLTAGLIADWIAG